MQSHRIHAFGMAAFLLLTGVVRPAESAASRVTGRVVDADGGAPVAGAVVRVAGEVLAVGTDESGRFELPAPTSGTWLLEVSCPGYLPGTLQVVSHDRIAELEILLTAGGAYSDAITVTGVSEAAVRPGVLAEVAGRQQISRLPDTSAAEAVQRFAGVFVERDKGEADHVLVRGAEARLVTTTLDGERLPSPEGEARSAGLATVPLDLLEAVAVSKIFRPDADADAIGGAVDLVTRKPPADGRFTFSLDQGHGIRDGGDRRSGAATLGRRYLDGRLGVLLAASGSNEDRATDRRKTRYDGDEVSRLELRDYSLDRHRSGAAGALDFALSDDSEHFLRAFYNGYEVGELRRRVKLDLEDRAIDRELKDSTLEREIFTVSSGGSHLIGRSELDYTVSYLHAGERDPDRVDTSFVQEDVEFDDEDPQRTPGSADPQLFRLAEIGLEDNTTAESNVAATVNLAVPWRAGTGQWKVGAKVRQRSRSQDLNTALFEPVEELLLAEVLDTDFPTQGFRLGPMIDRILARELVERLGSAGRRSLEEEAADYDASESTLAGYGLVELGVGSRVDLLAGLRYEHTRSTYSGLEVIAGEDASDPGSIVRFRQGERNYGELLPMAQAAVRLNDGMSLKLAVTRTFARPDYFDLVPFEIVDLEDLEIERGNPRLEATRAWNFDAAFDWSPSAASSLSAGGFYKSITDFTYVRGSEIRLGSEDFEVSQPENGDSAELFGLEILYRQRLPERLVPGLSWQLGFTAIGSRAELPERGLVIRLPGQASHVGSLILSYDRKRFSAAVSGHLVGDYLFELGASPGEDVYMDDQLRLDLSASFEIAPGWRLFLRADNLADEPSRLYQGSPGRPFQEERYGGSATLGVRLEL